jgi:hypothetical protein
MKRKLIVTGITVLALAAGGVGVASALGTGGESDDSVTGPGADQARAAALAIVDGGKANSVERDGENGATWEVEVTKPDGNTVDVRLDSAYKLVAVESDHEQADGPGSDAGEGHQE